MRRILLTVLTIVSIWGLWSYSGRSPEWESSELALDVKEQVSADSLCTRNIVGMQPYMLTRDYLGEKQFYEKMKGYFELARQAGYFRPNTVVLLPEYLGTWLVIDGEKISVAESASIQNAMTLMVASNPLKFSRYFFIHQQEQDRFAAAIFRMKADRMAEIYGQTFTRLAKEYSVTINAGSIVLPGPGVTDNRITVDTSLPLYNTSFMFTENGGIHPRAVRKSFPIHSELPFVKAAPMKDLPVFDLAIGKTAVLVCADSWYPESYQQIRESGAEIVLVNSYCSGRNTMAQPWKGYDGGATPGDVDGTDISRLTEREAWVKYALPGRIGHTPALIGVNIFLRGELWDLGTDGQPFFVQNGKLMAAGKSDRAGIWNFCF